METIPSELLYTATHEWLRQEADDVVVIGISQHAQELLGDIVFVELPDIDVTVHSSDEVGVIESVKAASDLYSPVSGTIIEVNENLTDSPSLVNLDPYGDGWILKIKMQDATELSDLLDAEAYLNDVVSAD